MPSQGVTLNDILPSLSIRAEDVVEEVLETCQLAPLMTAAWAYLRALDMHDHDAVEFEARQSLEATLAAVEQACEGFIERQVKPRG